MRCLVHKSCFMQNQAKKVWWCLYWRTGSHLSFFYQCQRTLFAWTGSDAFMSLWWRSQVTPNGKLVINCPQNGWKLEWNLSTSHPVCRVVKSRIKAQKLAIDQRRNFGEEIAQSIRTTKKKRWEDLENKRKQQEIELEDYLINLVKSKEGESEQVNV